MNKYFKQLKHYFKNQRGGTALLLTLMVMGSVLFVVLAVSDVVRNGLIASQSQVHSTKAYFAAESGAERILWEIRKNRLFVTISCNDDDFFCYNNPGYGNIVNCNGTCPAGEEVQQYFSIDPPNNVFYKIKYNYDGINTEITSTGSYIDPKNKSTSLNRVIKVYY